MVFIVCSSLAALLRPTVFNCNLLVNDDLFCWAKIVAVTSADAGDAGKVW